MELHDRRPPTRPTLGTATPYFTKSGVGKLFADPKPGAEHRYPRGYTPERMADVRGAVPIFDANYASGLLAVGSGLGGVPNSTPAASRVLETIARSTAPMSDFTTMHPNNGRQQQRLKVTVNSYDPSITSGRLAGFYRGPRRFPGGGVSSTGQAHIAAGREDTATVTHELGHHVSTMVEKNPHADYDTPTKRGKEEARADDYAQEHFRADQREKSGTKKRRNDPAYESLGTWKGLGGKRAHASYLKARTTPIVRDRRDQERSAKQRQGDAEWAISRDRLFHRQGLLPYDASKPYGEENQGGWVPNERHLRPKQGPLRLAGPGNQLLLNDQREYI